jgi:phosphoribosylamine--glycine ligase
VLIVGSGAREHALARAMLRSASVAEVLVSPGNAGMAAPIRRIAGSVANDVIVALAKAESIDLVVVGPEAPLCDGLVDALEGAGIKAFGPSRSAARLEGSKAFLKQLARSVGIPTADFDVVTSYEEAESVIRRRGAPIVVKADGLCAGKGVVVAATVEEALSAARAMLVEKVFGAAGETVVIEACLSGVEASVLAITDAERLLVLPVARDHKRIFDGDRGPNTGGMGVIAPVAEFSKELIARIEAEVLKPTLDGMRAMGAPFRGVLFAGLMITPEGTPMLLEHNVRFGDPECEALMALLEGDVGELLASAADGRLDISAVRVSEDHATVVVMAASGYPEKPRTGDRITGIEEAEKVPSVVVHHAGTALSDGALVTAGGRVLAVTATGVTADEARQRAYAAAAEIRFDGAQYRRDIGIAQPR